MTPQSISQRARELWESAKAQDGWDGSMRMAYIMGACDGMADMQAKLHPFERAIENNGKHATCESVMLDMLLRRMP